MTTLTIQRIYDANSTLGATYELDGKRCATFLANASKAINDLKSALLESLGLAERGARRTVTLDGVSIRRDGDDILVTSEYSDDWRATARQLGGRWNRNARAWVFGAAAIDAVTDALDEIYGHHGAPVDVVTVRVTVDRMDDSGNECRVGGLTIAKRRERDWGVRTVVGVTVVGGAFPRSGGSRKNPAVFGRHGDEVRIEIKDFPVSQLAELSDRHQVAIL